MTPSSSPRTTTALSRGSGPGGRRSPLGQKNGSRPASVAAPAYALRTSAIRVTLPSSRGCEPSTICWRLQSSSTEDEGVRKSAAMKWTSPCAEALPRATAATAASAARQLLRLLDAETPTPAATCVKRRGSLAALWSTTAILTSSVPPPLSLWCCS